MMGRHSVHLGNATELALELSTAERRVLVARLSKSIEEDERTQLQVVKKVEAPVLLDVTDTMEMLQVTMPIDPDETVETPISYDPRSWLEDLASGE